MVVEALIVERPSGDLTAQQMDQIYHEFVEAHPVIASSAAASAASRPSNTAKQWQEGAPREKPLPATKVGRPRFTVVSAPPG